MSIDVQMFVNKIQTILFAIVAEDVMFTVCIAKLHDFTTNEIADASPDVDECKAVGGDPET